MLKAQAAYLDAIELQCRTLTAPAPTCEQIHDQRLLLHRKQADRNVCRAHATAFFSLSLALPAFLLALARWWYWVITGRFRARERKGKHHR